MTSEAQKARDVAIEFECKKDGLKQVQSGDVKLTLTVSPLDMPNTLYSDPMGQRYIAVIVPLNDDETPKETVKPKSFATSAKMLAKDEAFHSFCKSVDYDAWLSAFIDWKDSDETKANCFIRYKCQVDSCAELIEGSEAGKKFKKLQGDYMFWKEYQ